MITTAQNLYDDRELMATPAWKPIALRYFTAAGADPEDKRCPTPFYPDRVIVAPRGMMCNHHRITPSTQ
jgi:hypothetical protein